MTAVSLAAPSGAVSARPGAMSRLAASDGAASRGASPAAASAPVADPAGTATKAAGFAGGDFDTFLKMLTTQIRHQDPLNPMEGSDFAVQLATFSGVEQQVRTNQLLEQLAVGSLGGLGTLAGWIGKEVRTTAPIGFTGQPLTLDLRPAPGATRAQLVVLDAKGAEVSRQAVEATAGERAWPGLDSDGRPLPAGLYSFKLVSLEGDEIVKTQAVGAYALVTGAEITAEGVRLTLPDGASALESEVTALRGPV